MGSVSVTSLLRGDSGGWHSNYGLDGPVGPEYSVSYGLDEYGYIEYVYADYLDNVNQLYVCEVNAGATETLQSLEFKVDFYSSNFEPSEYPGQGGHYVTARCYAYNSQPSGSSSPPSGYIGSDTQSVYISRSGTTVTFNLNTPNAGSTLYLWVTISDAQPAATYQGWGVYSSDDASFNDIAGNFQALALSFSIAESSVYTGGSMNVTVYNQGNNALTAQLKYGSTVILTYTLPATSSNPATYTFTADKSWFDAAGVTMLKQITLTATLTDGTRTASPQSFTLNAGNDMAPSLGVPTLTLVQTGRAATYYPNTWIAGYSKAAVAVAVTLPTNAGVSSVTLSYSGGTTVTMSYNSYTGKYEGLTASPLTGDTTLIITVTDVRGMVKTAIAPVSNVLAYSDPYISLQSLFRCDSLGVQTDGGTYYSIKVIASCYTGLSGNAVTLLTAKVGGGGTPSNLTSNVTSVLPGLSDADSAYTIIVSVQDKVSNVIERSFILAGAHHDVQILYANGHTHVGIGMAPENKGAFDSLQLPSGGKIYIGGVQKLS